MISSPKVCPKASPARPDLRLSGTVILTIALLGSPTIFGDRFPHDSVQRPRSAGVKADDDVRPVLWREPTDLEHRDLFYGSGDSTHQPHGTFTFIKEDLEGSHPKFDVRDGDGVEWKVKLGTEARPETAANRLVWAVGYSAEEDYFVDEIRVDGVPAHVHRGQRLIDRDGTMHGARLKRKSDDLTKVGEWKWRQNPFSGTRELNALRTLMAVMNNWDVKDINNTVYEPKKSREEHPGERVYEVSDLGSTFGSTGLERTDHPNGDLQAYRRSHFITRRTSEEVDFETPRVPDWIVLANAPEFFRRLRLLWFGKHIPRADAKWAGVLLSRISPAQIQDAFRAAGYRPDEVAGFVEILSARIRQLREL